MAAAAAAPASAPRWTLVVHGGAGSVSPASVTEGKESLYHEALRAALAAGAAVLSRGGSALDAVEAAVVSLEDCPLFNAGRGSVLTSESTVEMDASVMRGADGAAGAVGAVSGIKNPVRAARAVMERSAHVLLVGKGAESLARECGLEFRDAEYFITDMRRVQLQHAQAKTDRSGTVGAVARDATGRLAAATSTGGMTNKRPGRLGDTPIIGAGTFADDATCAVSCTGHGEYIIRAALAHEVSSRMALAGAPLERAASEALRGRFAQMGGEGGLIAVDAAGRVALEFNTERMYRGVVTSDAAPTTRIFRDS